jgi:hypothetical protein
MVEDGSPGPHLAVAAAWARRVFDGTCYCVTAARTHALWESGDMLPGTTCPQSHNSNLRHVCWMRQLADTNTSLLAEKTLRDLPASAQQPVAEYPAAARYRLQRDEPANSSLAAVQASHSRAVAAPCTLEAQAHAPLARADCEEAG